MTQIKHSIPNEVEGKVAPPARAGGAPHCRCQAKAAFTVRRRIAPSLEAVVLGVIVYQLRSPARRSQELVETCATYWHTVDFLWVLIFALL